MDILSDYYQKFGPPPQWTPDIQEETMNLMKLDEHGIILNAETKAIACNCPYHGGETVYQVKGLLCNGKPFIVQLDSGGYHVSIGDVGDFPEGVSLKELEKIIYEAIRD